MPLMKGTRDYEPLYYRYAYTFYYMKDYLSAAYHFKNFVDFFPASKDAEECEFMHAVCLYKQSPKYSLDQTNTIKAMEALQSYINTHPGSNRITEANTYMDKCRVKLELKEADAAKLYYNIGQYKAASIAYREVIKDYPESPNSDYYQFMIIKSLYNYAVRSVETKQEERYANVLNAFREMNDNFPKSRYIDDATKFSTLADNNVKRIRNYEHQ